MIHFLLLFSWLQKWCRMSAHPDLHQQRMCRSMSIWKVWHQCPMFSKESPCCLHLSVRLQARSRSIHSLQTIWVSHWSWLCQYFSMCQWEMCQSLSMCQICRLLCQKSQGNLYLCPWIWRQSIWSGMYPK